MWWINFLFFRYSENPLNVPSFRICPHHLCDGPLGDIKLLLFVPWVSGPHRVGVPRETSSSLGHSQVNNAEPKWTWAFIQLYIPDTPDWQWVEQVQPCTAFKATQLCSKQYSLQKIKLKTTHTNTHTHTHIYRVNSSHRQSSSLLHWTLMHLSLWPLAWVHKWRDGIFQEKAAAESDRSSLRGRGQVWSTFYYLPRTAHVWRAAHSTQWPCHAGSHPELKQRKAPHSLGHPRNRASRVKSAPSCCCCRRSKEREQARKDLD